MVHTPAKLASTPVSRRTTVIYVTALLLIAGLSISSHLLTSAIIQRQAATAGTVNMAGRQRMLAQRIFRISLQMADGSEDFVQARVELIHAITQMERERENLLHGSVSPRILAPSTPRLQTIYFDQKDSLEDLGNQFLDRAKHLAATRHEEVSLSNKDLAAIGFLLQQKLLPALEASVAAYQADSEEAIQRLKQTTLLLLCLMLLLLLAEALFLYRPLFHRLKVSYDALITAARTDPLTGSLNRRAFLEECAKIFQRFRRTGSPIAMLSMDLDHFKSINDTWGHATGDRVILEFVAATLSCLRPHDRMGRLGGEEFSILLPNTLPETAFALAESIRSTVASVPVTSDTGEELHFSVSIGIAASFPGDGDIFAVLARADRNLYAAKEQGRNRVAVT